ncbi:hypothetical protein Acid345_2227 [Candidatus Koribacter versatilis Ellin345]|uniref:Lipoprotein n=1 Tax=Koribacter versatilis (strain Ellin345) TaxID=204669 RepID=Q1IPH2_KORVE|nr:hypothetical protein [Candidatus Koribacter versatilis]ABF41228.1 hypothetical protein Acid345_2227 [Candidatus Koribacter versatilis Ellin345]
MRIFAILGIAVVAIVLSSCEHKRSNDPWSGASSAVRVDVNTGEQPVRPEETLVMTATVSGYSGLQKGTWRIEETQQTSHDACAFDIRTTRNVPVTDCPFGYILFDPHSSSKSATFHASKFPGTFHVTYVLEMIGTGRFDRSVRTSGTAAVTVSDAIAVSE